MFDKKFKSAYFGIAWTQEWNTLIVDTITQNIHTYIIVPTYQCTHKLRSVSQSISQSVTQSVNQSVSQSLTHSLTHSLTDTYGSHNVRIYKLYSYVSIPPTYLCSHTFVLCVIVPIYINVVNCFGLAMSCLVAGRDFSFIKKVGHFWL